MNILLKHVLERLVRKGSLKITDPKGSTSVFGDGTGDPVHIQVKTAHAERAITFDPMLAVPEAYRDGELDIVVMSPRNTFGWIEGLRHAFRRLQQVNTAARARRNVQRHYDLSGDLYRLFLDEDMQYSCAYFEQPDITLDEAQMAKKRHIAAKLRLKPGQTVLDIGSGWGGLGIYLAKTFDVDVQGVTLSTEQHGVSTDRAHAQGLESRVHFELKDYRDINERFDSIVSVGMFEHVGVNHYRTFFEKCATMLKPDGVMLLHTIGRSGMPWATSAFIRKYIFPGGYIPSLSEVMPAIERSGLVVTDIEILRLHYADTIKNWSQRFQANRDKARAIYDERFCRMWEFYLGASEAAFRWQDLVNFQIQLTRKNDTLPMSRDYMAKCEKALEMRDMGRRERQPMTKPVAEPIRKAAAPKAAVRRRKVSDTE